MVIVFVFVPEVSVITAALLNAVVAPVSVYGTPSELNVIKLFGKLVGDIVIVIPVPNVTVALPVIELFTAVPPPLVIE